MTLMEAYFDESGTHDGSPYLCVAGYIIESNQAKEMAREWNQAVFAKGLTHFHMIDCAHGVNEFEKLTLAERIELATSLIGLIKTNIVRGLGAAVIESEYDLLMPYHQNIGGPYNYCLWENMLA